MSLYAARFDNVIRYIEANLDKPLDLDTLCQIASFSKYHFHRQCSVYFGMSVMSLVKLLRLKKAAYALAYRSEIKVVDIAFASGYESHEAFSRAFKSVFQQRPSDFRQSPDWTPWQTHYAPILKLRSQPMCMTDNIDVTIVEYPETLIATLTHRGAPSGISHTLQQFIAWRKANQLPPSRSKTFNLLYDDPNITAPEDFRLGLACSVEQAISENSDGIENSCIPAGRCAVVRHTGSDDALGTIIHQLYLSWLPASNNEVRDFPIFLERMNFFPDVPENEWVTDIYLPII